MTDRWIIKVLKSLAREKPGDAGSHDAIVVQQRTILDSQAHVGADERRIVVWNTNARAPPWSEPQQVDIVYHSELRRDFEIHAEVDSSNPGLTKLLVPRTCWMEVRHQAVGCSRLTPIARSPAVARS